MTFDISFVARQYAAKEKEACEDSLLRFLEVGWKYIDPANFQPGWHLEAMAEHLQAVTDGQIQKLVINVPPRSSKSSLCSVAWTAWTWAQPNIGPLSGPQVQFLSASYAHTLSLRDSVKTRRLIQSSWYQGHWADRFHLAGDQNAKHRFENDKGGYRLATSVDGTTTGEGGDCFPAGTRVLTPKGPVKIENIAVGQEVFAFDERRQMVVKSRVEATKSRVLKGLYEFRTIKGYRFACTANHPIYTPRAGYIRACDLGVGEWLLGKEVWEAGVEDAVQSRLHDLWREISEAPVRCQESAAPRQSRFLLLNRMSGHSFFDKAFKDLRDLWEASKESPLAVLFRRVRGSGAGHAPQEESLSSVWGRIRGNWKFLLQSRMCQFGSFGTDARQPQLQVQGTGEIFQSVQGDWRVDSRARRAQVRSLRPSRQVNSNWKGTVAEEIISSGPSYRREYEKQCPREPDSSMSFVPQEAPSWHIDRIASIVIHCNDEHRVYDIQVGRWHNFFAEGVLVHNCIIIDDPHKAGQDSESEKVRLNTLMWWDEAMSTRLNNQNTGAYVIVMQRLHMEDLTGHVLTRQEGAWTHLMLPMEFEPARKCVTFVKGERFWEDPRTEDGELLCPERFSPQIVANLKQSMGPYPAAGQLQQAPTPRGGGLIKDEWWRHWTEKTYPQCEFVVASLDTAYTEKQENDFSALSIWGVFRQNPDNVIPIELARQGPEAIEQWYLNQWMKVILLYQWQERLNFPDLVKKVIETCTTRASPLTTQKVRFRADKLLIEGKAAGMSVAQELYRQLGHSGDFGIEVIGLNKGRYTPDKVARLIAVQHMFANGMIYVPWPTTEEGNESPHGYKWVEEAMDQVGIFPKAPHDDFVDSMTQALQWLRDSGILQRPEEHQRDVREDLAYKPQLAPLYPGV